MSRPRGNCSSNEPLCRRGNASSTSSVSAADSTGTATHSATTTAAARVTAERDEEIKNADDPNVTRSTAGDGPTHPKGVVGELDCAICLQSCVHPVRLPCGHVFCFLCAKGAAARTHRCALCRHPVPTGYVLRPDLLSAPLPTSSPETQWFYEGVDGWWQYDERASAELELAHQQGAPHVEMLIAGYVYVVDFERMVQVRRSDPTRRRRVKRDRADIADRKGVAGLKLGVNRCATGVLPTPRGDEHLTPTLLAAGHSVAGGVSSQSEAGRSVTADTPQLGTERQATGSTSTQLEARNNPVRDTPAQLSEAEHPSEVETELHPTGDAPAQLEAGNLPTARVVMLSQRVDSAELVVHDTTPSASSNMEQSLSSLSLAAAAPLPTTSSSVARSLSRHKDEHVSSSDSDWE